jgi:hypothetical protein
MKSLHYYTIKKKILNPNQNNNNQWVIIQLQLAKPHSGRVVEWVLISTWDRKSMAM